jgi:hypothetical protein
MPEVIDIEDIAAESLVLALPAYPRAAGATFGSEVHAEDGIAPLQDTDLKPFAGLAALAGRLGVSKPSEDVPPLARDDDETGGKSG